MQEAKIIWQNGKLIPWHEAKVHVLTHSLHYGSGAFEGIRFYKTKRGPAIFRLTEHIDRFFYSTRTLKMDLPYNKEQIRAAIIDVASANELEEGYIRPIAYYGYGKMGVNPARSPLEIAIACWIWGAYLPHNSVDIKTSSYIRIHPDSTVVDAKLCGHYINGVLATLELKGTHYHEALFLDSEGYISEGVGENFFMVKQNVIHTPKLGTILSGITRDTVIKIAAKLGLAVKENNYRIEDAYQADEAFFTGTAAEVTPIRSIDDKLLTHNPVGPVTAAMKEAYHKVVRGEEADFINYLTFLNSNNAEISKNKSNQIPQTEY